MIIIIMSDRRGHRIFYLYSNKYYEMRKYFSKKLIGQTVTFSPTSLSLSSSVYSESSVPSLDILCDRMQCPEILSEGK